jgi:Flp pilus assembly protein TadD
MNVQHEAPRAERDPVNDVHQAVRLHQEGRLEEADRLYREALARNPGNANALHLLGVLQAQRLDFVAAADLIGRSIALEPGNPFACYNRGNGCASSSGWTRPLPVSTRHSR